MKNRYYVLRHGESVANRKGLIVSHPENALTQYGLTTQGAEQVMRTAASTRLDEGTVIISSDYLRAYETAQILHGIVSVDQPVQTDERLRERNFGHLELQDHQNYEAVWQADALERSMPGIESVKDVLCRALSLVNELDRRFNGKTILLVGHGDVLQILLAYFRGVEPHHHRTLKPIRNAEIRSLLSLSQQKVA